MPSGVLEKALGVQVLSVLRVARFAAYFLLLTCSTGALAIDSDGDGVDDSMDAFPVHAEASVDTDGDGMPDVVNLDAAPIIFTDQFGTGTFTAGGWSASGPWIFVGVQASANYRCSMMNCGFTYATLSKSIVIPAGGGKLFFNASGNLVNGIFSSTFNSTGMIPGNNVRLLAAGNRSLEWDIRSGGYPVTWHTSISSVVIRASSLLADLDDDNDGIADSPDNCSVNANADQLDTDGDTLGDACDADDDNDGVLDINDAFPLDANRWLRSRHNTDFDNDSDVLIRSATTGTWTRYSIQNNAVVGSGAINAPTSSDSVYVAQLDANGDGDADILTRSATTGAWTLSIVENGAVTSSIPLYLYANLGYVFVGVGDFNNDGTDDVMLRHANNGYRVFLLANHAVSTSVYYNAWTAASSVDQGIGDFNGDGTDDLLVRRTSDNLYFIFKTINGEVNNYYCACNIWANPAWTFQFAGDTNKDGKDDIVIRGTGASADGKWWAFRMNNFSSVLTTNLNLFINKTAITVGAVGDYNGDGTIDVLTRVNNSTTYVSPITNGTVGGNYLLYNFTTDQVIGR